jgi:flagellar hook-length control protein FliK
MNIGLIALLLPAPLVTGEGEAGVTVETGLLSNQPFGQMLAQSIASLGDEGQAQIEALTKPNGVQGLLLYQVAADSAVTAQQHAEFAELLNQPSVELPENVELLPTMENITLDELTAAFQSVINPVSEQSAENPVFIFVTPSSGVALPVLEMPAAQDSAAPMVEAPVVAPTEGDITTSLPLFAVILRANPAVQSIDAEAQQIIRQDIADVSEDVSFTLYGASLLVLPAQQAAEATLQHRVAMDVGSVSQAGVDTSNTVQVTIMPSVPPLADAESNDAWQQIWQQVATGAEGGETEAADTDLDALVERILAQPVKGGTTNSVEDVSEGPYRFVNQSTTQIAVTGQAQSLAVQAPELAPIAVDVVDMPIEGFEMPISGAPGTVNAVATQHADSSHHLLRMTQGHDPAKYTTSEQVQVTIRQAFEPGMDRVIIQLEPQDLGRVEIRIESGADGRNHILFSAENRDTLDLLQRDARLLERALQEAGVKADAGDMQFTLNQQRQDGQGEYAEERQPHYGENVAGQLEQEVVLDPLTGNYTLTVTDGVDIRV